jgi:outer membrane immunogenic protein
MFGRARCESPEQPAETLMTRAVSIAVAFALSCAAFTAAPRAAEPQWTAPYLGLFLGYGDASDAWDQGGAPGDPQLSPEGIMFGGFAGYTHDVDGLVLGVEGDLTFPDFSDAAECTAGADCAVDVRVLSSLRARGGAALGAFQVYAAAGLALGYLQAETNAPAGLSDNASLSGWTLGGGIDYETASRIRLGIEYRHSDYGSADVALGPTGGDVRLETDEVRARLSIPLN